MAPKRLSTIAGLLFSDPAGLVPSAYPGTVYVVVSYIMLHVAHATDAIIR
jgi:hypothetical protein